MIYDLLMFNDETDILELRLRYLFDVVDYFIIVESTRTFSNIKKKLVLDSNWDRFELYKDKIIYQVFDGPFSQNAWENENRQRNLLIKAFNGFNFGDLIIHGDLDEIPNKKVFSKIISRYPNNKNIVYSTISINYFSNPYLIQKRLYLYQKLFFWDYVENYTEAYNNINYNKFLIEEINQGFSLMKIRFHNDFKLLSNIGWHVSYFGDIDFIFNKLKAFSHHDEFDLTHNDIQNIINNGKFIDGNNLLRLKKDYFGIQQFLPNLEYPLHFKFDLFYSIFKIKIFILIMLNNSSFLKLILKKTPRSLKDYFIKIFSWFSKL